MCPLHSGISGGWNWSWSKTTRSAPSGTRSWPQSIRRVRRSSRGHNCGISFGASTAIWGDRLCGFRPVSWAARCVDGLVRGAAPEASALRCGVEPVLDSTGDPVQEPGQSSFGEGAEAIATGLFRRYGYRRGWWRRLWGPTSGGRVSGRRASCMWARPLVGAGMPAPRRAPLRRRRSSSLSWIAAGARVSGCRM